MAVKNFKKKFFLQEKNIIKYLQSHITSKKFFIYTKIKNNKYSSLLKKINLST